MGIGVAQTIEPRTLLSAVQRIIRGVGDTQPGTVTSPTRRVVSAIDAVNNAVLRIFEANKWEWRTGFARIDLADDTMWYPVKDDFNSMAGHVSAFDKGYELQYVTWRDLCQSFPDIRAFPPGAGVSDLTTILQLSGKTDYFGDSQHYVLLNGYIGLFKIPDEDFVAEQVALYYLYNKDPVDLVADSDQIPLPKSLWNVHHLLALGEFKQMIQYGDFAADLQRGEALLREAIAGDTDPMDTDETTGMDIAYDYGE